MAWCPHCKENRPIQRQTFKGKCAFCGRRNNIPHLNYCRGPVEGALDVCTYCNTPVFAKSANEIEYESLVQLENKIDKDACFVVTATMGDPEHQIVDDMRQFRDDILSKYFIGNFFIKWYYKHGPRIAEYIGKNSFRRKISYNFMVFPVYILVKLCLRFKNYFYTSK